MQKVNRSSGFTTLEVVIVLVVVVLVVIIGATVAHRINKKTVSLVTTRHTTQPTSNTNKSNTKSIKSNSISSPINPTATSSTSSQKTASTSNSSAQSNKSPTSPATPSGPVNYIPVFTSSGLNYYYSAGYQYASASGASVNFTQAQPIVNSPKGENDHSDIELAVSSSNVQNYVEVGWIVAPDTYGDSSPHLFASYWVNGEFQCYNGCGFVQVSKTNSLGEILTVGTTGSFEVNYSGGNWYIRYNGDEVGYYPESLWSGGYTQAGLITVYGEVTMEQTACIQMGNGILGSNPGSAQISNFTLLGSSSSVSLTDYATSPYDYGAETPNSLNIGGPGIC